MANRHVFAVGLLLALYLPPEARSQQAALDKQAEPGTQAASPEKERIAERDRLAVEVQKLRNEGKLADAIAAAEKVLVIEHEMAADHPQELAFGLDYTAGLHEQLEEYAAARKLLAERLALVSKLLGKDDWRVTDARLALDKATLLEKFTPEERRQLARANQLGSAFAKLYAEGKFRDAVAPAVEAKDIARKLLGERDVGYANTLNNLAMLHKSLGEFAEAGALAQQALAIDKEVLGEKHPHYVVGLNNLAEVYVATGDYTQAEPLYQRALQLRKDLLGDKHPDYAQSLNSLAVLYDSRGDYVRAEPLYRQALEIRKTAFGEKDPSYATTLNNLAGLYAETGDDVKAEALYRQVLAIRKEILGEKHPAYADTLDDLAAIYRDRRDFARAEPLYQQAVEIRKATFGQQHPAYAKSLNNLALLYQSMEEYAKAQPLFIEALVINGNAFGENHPEFAVSVNNLATFYQAAGKFEKAVSLHEKVIQIDKRTLGEKHPGYAIDLYNLAVAYQSMGNDAKAAPLFLESLHVYREQLDLMAAVQSERQQLNMFAKAEDALGSFLAVAKGAKLPIEQVYAEVLVWKGSVGVRQRAMRRLRETLATNGSSEAARLFDNLTRKSQALANLSLAAVEPGHEEEHRRRLAELSDEVAQAERSLAAASREFRRELEQNHRTPADLQNALPADAVLVDLVEYNHFTPPTEKVKLRHWERHLTAFLVRRDKPLERVELGPVAPIERAIQSWRRKFVPLATDEQPDPSVSRTAADDQDSARQLRELIWDKLQSRLAGAPIVLISPDQATARFPWPAMPGKEPGTYLIEESAIVVVPIPRLLAELGHDRSVAEVGADKAAAREASLLLVGDVNYDANPGRASTGTIAQSAPRGTRAGQLLHWPPLDGTRTEMATIADSFEQQFPDGRLDKLRGDRATKEALIARIPDHRYVHLATHGFFAPKELKSALGIATGAEKRDGGNSGISPRDFSGYPPGLLSGLVLAGANQPAVEGNDNGILTALEVSQLDLRRVDLATLSACETGLGETAGGEGVLGLQRAFQIAGAKSVVATLWRISDDASRALMIDFYDNLWQKKMSKLEALRRAQLKMLRAQLKMSPRGAGRGLKFADDQPPDSNHRLPPYYWAPFVLSGDWQ